MAQPSYVVVQRDFNQADQRRFIVISRHHSLGSANLNAHRWAHRWANDVAGGADRLEVTYHHFGGYSAYCQTGDAQRGHFEVEVVRADRQDPLYPPQGNNIGFEFHRDQLSLQQNAQQPPRSMQPQPAVDGNQVPQHGQTLPPIAPLLRHVSQQPTPPAAAPLEVQHPRVAYTVTRTDYNDWKDDARADAHILGVFLDLNKANAAAWKHAKRQKRVADLYTDGMAEPVEQSTNHVNPNQVTLECRTMEDERDHFVVEVTSHSLDLLNDDHQGETDDEDEGEDVDEDDPPAKRRRL